MFKYICNFCVLLIVVQSAKLPKTWKTCKQNDPNYEECMKTAIEEAIRELGNGNPPLGVLPMDPLHFDGITIDQGTGPVSIKLDFSDLDLKGFKNIKIQSVKNDWKTMEIKMVVPTLTLAGKYKIAGKVLVLPISGDGDCELVFTNYKASCNIKLKQVTKGSKKHYEVETFPFVMDTEKVHIQFNNLFNGDKALGDNMNRFLNENSKEILGELGPAISRAFGAGFKEIANRIFSKVPINEFTK